MKGETGERWRTLCEQAAEEQDPKRLMELIQQINQLLDAKESRLLSEQPEAKKETAA